MKTWLRISCALSIVALTGVSAARGQSQTAYSLTLSHAEASVDPAGRPVLTMMARGDLQGVLTVVLERSADGTVTGGEWALTVSYTEIVAPTSTDGGDDDPGERLVQKGVLKGTVTGGQVAVNGDGAIDALSGVQLLLTGGTLAYDGAASGAGSIDGTSLTDRDAFSGSSTLAF